jgi:hypothetical protein
VGIIGILILFFVGLPILIGFLLYFIPKRLGYPKTGKYLSITFGLVVIVFLLLNIFEDQLFTKSNAKQLLVEEGFYLKDDFKINENKSMWSIGDYYHKFVLKISEQDKRIIINEITHSANFKRIDLKTEDNLMYYGFADTQSNVMQVLNYEKKEFFVREYFKPAEKEGYAPEFRIISIDKKENILIFEDVDR